ncbi:thiamine biosynthesis lipoprotein [Dysgonomonadaceae bacterium PH5-43]|nr:thiamine biosynthesis lipoprotein [Dysgonomonadaceae bacterium PH5-43]
MTVKAYPCLFLLLILLFTGCNSKDESVYYHTKLAIFKTSANFKYNYTKELGAEISARLDSFDLSLNPFNNNSIIYKVNNNIDVEVDDYFITCFNKAQEIAALTDGVYDITAAPLINLWGFGFQKMDSVTPEAIDSLKQFVGYEKVNLEAGRVVKKDPRLQLNMSSIAKGYACDVIADLFDSYAIEDYMVEIGGEVRAKGKNPNGNLWKIGIASPLDDKSGAVSGTQETLSLDNYALATSGNYRNYYIKDGKKYAHTISPKTGYPSESNLLSASVIYPDCMTADAFATAFMALGIDKAEELAKQIPELSYLFIYEDANGDLKSLKVKK